MSSYSIRSAAAQDEAAIRRLVHEAEINPTGLDWRRFVLAVAEDGQVAACGQVKPHGEDLRELASIAVTPAHQGRGLARAVINELLARTERPVYLMCLSKMEGLYERFGFRALSRPDMPRYFQRIHAVFKAAEIVRHTGEELSVMKLE